MKSEVDSHLVSEEQDLAGKRAEIANLEIVLIERELFLVNLRTELARFEGRYLREVGYLYAELDEWNARILELIADEEGSAEARTSAAEARSQAEESYKAANSEAAKTPDNLNPSPELKRLRNEVLKRLHPDLTLDEADRVLRTRLTQEANLAYLRGDAEALKRILEDYESRPESVKGIGRTADLLRLARQIALIQKRLAEIEAELTELTSSDLAKLMAKVDIGSNEGRHPLADMAVNVREQIEASRYRYMDTLKTVNK